MSEIPLVIIHNYLETFRSFLARTSDASVIEARTLNGDQALFWRGDHKLVISSAEIADANQTIERWGYQDVSTVYPSDATQQLSLDVMADAQLVAAIVELAGSAKKINMIPYATTQEFLQLAGFLRSECGLTVELIESPEPKNLWIRDLLDSKIGFRNMLTQWNINTANMPFGFICNDVVQVSDAVAWFSGKQQGCVVKADQGGSGVGNLFFSAGKDYSDEHITELLSENEFMQDDRYIVEELIDGAGLISPSLEFRVPAAGQGKPSMTYLCNQHFSDTGQFAGVYISNEFEQAAWYPDFYAAGTQIAEQVQGLGYVGTFDLDAIVAQNGDVYLVEINARRTGATFVDDFLRHVIGDDYGDQVSVYSQNKFTVAKGMALHEVEATLGDLLYPIKVQGRPSAGIVVLLPSGLRLGHFGYVVIGESLEQVKQLNTEMSERFRKTTL